MSSPVGNSNNTNGFPNSSSFSNPAPTAQAEAVNSVAQRIGSKRPSETSEVEGAKKKQKTEQRVKLHFLGGEYHELNPVHLDLLREECDYFAKVPKVGNHNIDISYGHFKLILDFAIKQQFLDCKYSFTEEEELECNKLIYKITEESSIDKDTAQQFAFFYHWAKEKKDYLLDKLLDELWKQRPANFEYLDQDDNQILTYNVALVDLDLSEEIISLLKVVNRLNCRAMVQSLCLNWCSQYSNFDKNDAEQMRQLREQMCIIYGFLLRESDDYAHNIKEIFDPIFMELADNFT